MLKYDVAIMGAGPGGYVAAIRLAQLGKKVVVIEKENVGGVCLNVGCIPSKAMIHASEVYHQMQKTEEMGITLKGIDIHPKKLQEWKEGIVKRLTGGIANLLKTHKIDLLKGEAAFQTRREIIVKGEKKETVTFDAAIVATGSSSIQIPGFKPDGQTIGTSTEALNYTEIPKQLCVIGGGYIGLEIGSLYAGLGSAVTVVEATASLLPGTDPDLVQVVARELKRRDVKVFLNTKAVSWKAVQGKAEVTVETVESSPRSGREGVALPALPVEGATRAPIKAGKQETISADKVIVAVGRIPNTKNLGLEKIGVQLDGKGFIKVNDQLKTNIDGIYAIGDCAGQPMLAHKASKEGLVAAAVIAGKRELYDVRAMPAVIFTTPEIATVGLDEKEAKDQGYEIKSGKFPFVASGKALASGETDGFVKVVADAKTDLVLGVQIVGAGASSLIGEAALAIEMGATSEDIARTVHPHPTLTETLMEAAEAIHGTAIHIFQR